MLHTNQNELSDGLKNCILHKTNKTMKKYLIILIALFIGNAAFSQSKKKSAKEINQVVEASCGQCKFGLKGNGCSLAVRLDGKAYFVDGADINQHGDAHADDGFCNAIRKAEVKGKIVNNRFKAKSFKLLPKEN